MLGGHWLVASSITFTSWIYALTLSCQIFSYNYKCVVASVKDPRPKVPKQLQQAQHRPGFGVGEQKRSQTFGIFAKKLDFCFIPSWTFPGLHCEWLLSYHQLFFESDHMLWVTNEKKPGDSKGFTKFARSCNIVQKLIQFGDSQLFFLSLRRIKSITQLFITVPRPDRFITGSSKPLKPPHTAEDQSAAPERCRGC